jgi:uncharacterized protein (DUF1697 family)
MPHRSETLGDIDIVQVHTKSTISNFDASHSETTPRTFISLLRGINVSGQNRIQMPELKRLYESLQLTNVETYIQSGNVIFDCDAHDPVPLAEIIEAAITRSFGIFVRVLLRDKEQFQQVMDANPFLNQKNEDPAKLYVTFISGLPSEIASRNLPTPTDAGDEFILSGDMVYLFCPDGYGRTKFSNSYFDRKLNVSATTRNWKTVKALFEMAKQR